MNEFLYTHGDCRYDDVCGCESLKGLPRWQYHLLALPITRTTAKRIYYRFPEGDWRDDSVEHYIDRAKFAGTRRHDRPGEAWVKTSGTTGYHLFLTPDKPEWFYDHADEVQPQQEEPTAKPTAKFTNIGPVQVVLIDLTDDEVRALFDSLIFMHDHLAALRVDTPNVDSALSKIKSLMTPSTYGLRIEALS